MNAIEVKSLTKRYGTQTAVDGISLSVSEDELYSLLGVNGAGKTTTVKMLSCLTEPDGGDAEIFGKSIISDSSSVKAMIAVSPQETAIAPNLSVKENLEMMAGIYGIPKSERADRISETAKALGLTEVMKKRSSKLSGGFKRRLSIAMALICSPRVLFLDEPTLALDVIARRELWDVITELKEKTTIMMTTHYMEEAERLSDRIGVMRDGKLLFSGTADEMKKYADTDSFEEAFVRIVREETK